MDHVDMEEIHNSFMELSQPPLSSLGMRGDLSMSHSIGVRKAYGKDHVLCIMIYLMNIFTPLPYMCRPLLQVGAFYLIKFMVNLRP